MDIRSLSPDQLRPGAGLSLRVPGSPGPQPPPASPCLCGDDPSSLLLSLSPRNDSRPPPSHMRTRTQPGLIPVHVRSRPGSHLPQVSPLLSRSPRCFSGMPLPYGPGSYCFLCPVCSSLRYLHGSFPHLFEVSTQLPRFQRQHSQPPYSKLQCLLHYAQHSLTHNFPALLFSGTLVTN